MPAVERAAAQAACDKLDEAQQAMAATTQEVVRVPPKICECVLDQTLPVRAVSASVLWAEVLASALAVHRCFPCVPLCRATGTSQQLRAAGEKADFQDELRALLHFR
jgi:hypothetical protein